MDLKRKKKIGKNRGQDPDSYCLKIIKVAFNIASEATFIFWVDQSTTVCNAKNGQFGEFLKSSGLRSNSVTRQVIFKSTKICQKCQNWMDRES